MRANRSPVSTEPRVTADTTNNVVDLPFAEPYHAGAMLAALSSHAVLGVEVSDVEAGTHRRALRTPNGPAVLALSFGGGRVTVATEPHVTDTRWLTTTVRRWLDLDADPRVIEAALGSDPLIGPLLAVRPGLRVLGYADPFEGAITTVIGQQVSLAATRTFGGRLVAAFGTRVRDGFSVFPTAEQLAALTPLEVQRAVGITSARARTVVRLAAAFAGGLTLEAGAEPAITRAALLELPGIGPWTVDYLSVRALGDRDAFVPGDLVLRRALGVATAKEADELAEAWRPFRAYALFHLWTTAAYLPSIGSTPGRDRR